MTESVISYKVETGVKTLPDMGISPQCALALCAMSRALEENGAAGYLADGNTLIGLSYFEIPKEVPTGWTREKDSLVIKPDGTDKGIKAKNYLESLLRNINTTRDGFGPNAGGIVEPAAKEEKDLSSASDIFTPSKP